MLVDTLTYLPPEESRSPYYAWELSSRDTSSVGSLLNAIVFNIIPIFVDIFIAVFWFIYMFDYLTGLIVLSTMVLYVTMTVVITEWRTKLDPPSRARAVDSLLNFETVKYYNNENYEVNLFEKSILEYQNADWKSSASLTLLNMAQNTVITVGLACGSLLCAGRVVGGELTVGDFIMFITYIVQLYQPLNFFGTYYRVIQQNTREFMGRYGADSDPNATGVNTHSTARVRLASGVHIDRRAFADFTVGTHPPLAELFAKTKSPPRGHSDVEMVSFMSAPNLHITVAGQRVLVTFPEENYNGLHIPQHQAEFIWKEAKVEQPSKRQRVDTGNDSSDELSSESSEVSSKAIAPAMTDAQFQQYLQVLREHHNETVAHHNETVALLRRNEAHLLAIRGLPATDTTGTAITFDDIPSPIPEDDFAEHAAGPSGTTPDVPQSPSRQDQPASPPPASTQGSPLVTSANTLQGTEFRGGVAKTNGSWKAWWWPWR
ncbi:ATP-binding cassette sub- B member 6, mitochondrial [Chytriomyces hyalinus]|nr:ATP-binding cassette sub- B member 6, mitochondrial [Chytriomyces hyalinus]